METVEVERGAFHIHNGWWIRREEHGGVTIEAREPGEPDAPLRMAFTVDAESWASMVAHVSARGETAETWYEALQFHNK